jgi:glucose/arabinose dehydrogenase/cytochrome c551/c552
MAFKDRDRRFELRSKILGFGVGAMLAISSNGYAAALPGDEHFKVETIAGGFIDAMEMAVASDGRVFVVERTGGVHLFDPSSSATTKIAQLEVALRHDEGNAREAGLLGITLDPQFDSNQWLYLYYSVPGVRSVQRLSRFTYSEASLGSEKIMLEFRHERENHVCHEGGSLTFGPDGNLFLSTGDNTCPFESSGFAPIDERAGQFYYDAQRSAANSNDLRGKVLRIRPTADGGYEIPTGNLFPRGMVNTRPEIYAMGCRNPFRISVDSRNGFLYWGEVGPDSGEDSERGHRGYDEVNQAKRAGNFGWPYFLGDNKAYASYDFATEKVGERFNPVQPVNDSPNNTGLQQLPPATEPLWYYPRASACAGPVYYYDDYPSNSAKLPRELDGCLIVYDWTSAWVRLLKLDAAGNIEFNEPWLGRHLFIHPVDMEMGSKGEVYLLEYGTPWYDGSDGKLKRITYTADPVSFDVARTDPRMKGLDTAHEGTDLISKSTCLACHTTEIKSIGPSYQEVAERYTDDTEAQERLANKVLKGGGGVWGPIPMPPHPQHKLDDARKMIDSILSLGQ